MASIEDMKAADELDLLLFGGRKCDRSRTSGLTGSVSQKRCRCGRFLSDDDTYPANDGTAICGECFTEEPPHPLACT